MGDLFFIASKTLGMAARAETWLLVAMALGLLALGRGRIRQAGVWWSLSLAFTLLLTLFPLGDGLLAGLERRYPADPPVAQVDDIIVLGGAEDIDPYRRWGGTQINEGGERLVEAVILARRFPEARLVYSGGTASLTGDAAPRDPSELMRAAWVALGVDPARIVLERASRNTAENARMTRDLIRPRPGQTHLLVTSAFHMPRAMAAFDRAGWQGLVPWPVDFRSGGLAAGPGWRLDRNLTLLDTALKEYLGLLAYRLAGR